MSVRFEQFSSRKEEKSGSPDREHEVPDVPPAKIESAEEVLRRQEQLLKESEQREEGDRREIERLRQELQQEDRAAQSKTLLIQSKDVDNAISAIGQKLAEKYKATPRYKGAHDWLEQIRGFVENKIHEMLLKDRLGEIQRGEKPLDALLNWRRAYLNDCRRAIIVEGFNTDLSRVRSGWRKVLDLMLGRDRDYSDLQNQAWQELSAVGGPGLRRRSIDAWKNQQALEVEAVELDSSGKMVGRVNVDALLEDIAEELKHLNIQLQAWRESGNEEEQEAFQKLQGERNKAVRKELGM